MENYIHSHLEENENGMQNIVFSSVDCVHTAQTECNKEEEGNKATEVRHTSAWIEVKT